MQGGDRCLLRKCYLFLETVPARDRCYGMRLRCRGNPLLLPSTCGASLYFVESFKDPPHHPYPLRFVLRPVKVPDASFNWNHYQRHLLPPLKRVATIGGREMSRVTPPPPPFWRWVEGEKSNLPVKLLEHDVIKQEAIKVRI
ncbi:hypothetical protein CDAR_213561 [Caerostris darwini]|uniref:Uncharacterized protein n=1 Tax=Caerostris darwini TaxID=1538125 RepID=A0AAV4T764_9ARAC|nr:hypothetical protein CDAR_213561 [Caerostris darwini]